MLVTSIKCIREPSSSLITALALMGVFLVMGIFGLLYTKKRKPFVIAELKKSLGTPQAVSFNDREITINTDYSEIIAPAKLLVAQYIANKNYVVYLAVKPHRIVVIPITQETKSSIDEIAAYYMKNRIPLKKLRV